MSLRIHIALFCWMTAGVACWGQQTGVGEAQHTFFVSQAQSDGVFEIGLEFSSEKDEWDYWKDQRKYERELYRKSPGYYAAYILAKREVYAAHRHLCGDECQHGDYFYIQSAFYLQFGEEDAALLTVMEKNQNAGEPQGFFRH